MSEPRSFLLLQGPMGSFFKKLAAGLRQAGHQTLRINFNGGDRLHFCSRHTMDFTGTLAQWPATVERIAREKNITDLIIYGDCRPLHQMAIRALKPLGVRVHVFEEGYFRPDWITLEQGGVNGYSPLPADAEFYRDWKASQQAEGAPRTEEFGSSFPRLVRHTVSYYVASALMEMRYRHYRTHRPRTYQKEGAAWLLRLSENYLFKRITRRHEQRMLDEGKPYFLVLLQLLGDSQITQHSPYHDMYEFLGELLNDFAQNAPRNVRLVVKNHPLDNGLHRYGSFLRQKARSLGLADWLVFLDGGHLPTLISGARGMVVVNSTGGLSAIHHGLPVKLMGTAVYGIDGLASRQPLSTFWHTPQPPDMELYRAFRQYVLHHAQVHGGFYTRSAIRSAVAGSLQRLLGDLPDTGSMV